MLNFQGTMTAIVAAYFVVVPGVPVPARPGEYAPQAAGYCANRFPVSPAPCGLSVCRSLRPLLWLPAHVFFQQVVDCDPVFFQLPAEIFHLREPLFEQGESFLFLLSGVQWADTVKGSFNRSGLFGEGNGLFE